AQSRDPIAERSAETVRLSESGSNAPRIVQGHSSAQRPRQKRRSHLPRTVSPSACATNTRVSAVATNRRQIWVATLGAALILGLVTLVGPIHQPLSYHDFADQRVFLGIAHAGDVLSNLGFLVVGFAGLFFLLPRSAAH